MRAAALTSPRLQRVLALLRDGQEGWIVKSYTAPIMQEAAE